MFSVTNVSGLCTSSDLNLVLSVGGREYHSHYFEGLRNAEVGAASFV
jgi:hypothetical protein